jgi:hypothetical protein
MTLVIACGNEAYTALIADRRLTGPRSVADNEFGKVMSLELPTARLGVASCGLARVGGHFRSNFDFPGFIRDAAQDGDLDALIVGFASRLDDVFASLPSTVTLTQRETAVLFAGYRYDETGRAQRFARAVGNRSSEAGGPRRFGVQDVFEGKPSNYICEMGAHEAVSRDGINALGELVKANRPARAVLGKAASIIRQAAETRKAGGVIGRQLTSLIIPSDRSRPPVTEYHTEHLSDRLYLPDFVALDSAGGGSALVGANVTTASLTRAETKARDLRAQRGRAQDATQRFTPIAFPRVRRNDPCPCGSGRRFKRCHGS